MSYLDQLRASLKQTLDTRGTKQSELEAILEVPTTEARSLNETEAASFEAAKAELKELDEKRTALESQITELEEIEARKADSQKALDALGITVATSPIIKVGKEARMYRPDSENHFLQDAYMARQGDQGAANRIFRHQQEESVERRDVGTSAFAGLTVPQYLTDMVAPFARARRPFADNCTNKHLLPADGMTLNISRITTGTATSIQATENATALETNIDDTLLTVNVRTISGMQDVSKQALQRGTGVLDIVVQDLVNAYNTNLDSSILNDDGTSGTHLGVRSTTPAANLVTYTDASPTAAEAYPSLFNASSLIEQGTFEGATHIVMTPRRWGWFASQVSTSWPFVQVYNTPVQTAGQQGERGYGVVGTLAGLPVITDANLPVNLGAGTNQDIILVVNASEMHLWEDPSAPLFVRFEQPDGNVAERIVLYGFSAFTAGRLPLSSAQINGTGLITPTF